jgi:hypothetical protein
MKKQMQWCALVVGFITLIAGSLGCATLLASSAANDHSDFYKPVLSDEIVAIGRPDESLSKTLGQPNVVAFLGKKNTYMLYKGGEELERITQLKLEGKRMDIDAARSHKLYLKDKQVWGELILTYGGGNEVSAAEQAELDKAGFSPGQGAKGKLYQKKVDIDGVIYPAIQLSNAQMAQLITRREFNLYNPRDAKPPMNVGATLMIPVAVAADIVLAPVYLGIGVVVIVSAALSH